MHNELKNAIYTLKKIRFFNALETNEISINFIIQIIRDKYHLSLNDSELYLYKKATNFSDIDLISKENLVEYILN